jgi:voltage-dependent potassium channel beta subunit
MNSQKITKMTYRYLGNSGLRVSILSWGNWVNVKYDDNITINTLKLAIQSGINYFDTAEVYGFGEGETSLGLALKEIGARREDLVISTKIFRAGYGENDHFLSRKHIIEGLNNSLKRLQLDYVDVVLAHRFDPITPMEEICRAFDRVINDGKAFYWGTSEWHPSQIMEAHLVCEKHNLIKPIVEQCQYNMLVRERIESEYVHLFKTIKLGTTVWSPLFSGILSGKYIEGIPEGTRLDKFAQVAVKHYNDYMANKEKTDKKLLELKVIAERFGCTLPILAIAWVIKNPDVTTCILGTSKVEQLQENLKALDVVKLITNEVEEEIEKILDNAPVGDMDWLTFTRLSNRRALVTKK